MNRAPVQWLTILWSSVVSAGLAATPLEDLTLTELEQRLQEIDTQLGQLSDYSLRGGIGAIGYRSESHDAADQLEWVRIDFGTTVPLDVVVLVPAIRRDTESGFQPDAFPNRFRLMAGADRTPDSPATLELGVEEGGSTGVAPLIIPCHGVRASWIRIEADRLSLRAFDERFVLQLSEILAFSGHENVALHRPVAVSSSSRAPGWTERFLVDGFVPYLMDAAQGAKSVAYLTPSGVETLHQHLTIDLGSPQPVSRIHLHAVDQSDTLPQAFAGDVGIPRRLKVQAAQRADFSDAVDLLDLHPETIYDVGPIMMWPVPETLCRYVRLTVVDPFDGSLYGMPSQWGFAEIEVFSRGRNVALGKQPAPSFEGSTPARPIANLTDGLNIYGNILPVREWMRQLAERHQLETERPRVATELSRRYAGQKTNLNRLIWLTSLLALGAVVIVLIERNIRQRALSRTRTRIAADLHDELGADLHAIGLLSDLAQTARSAPDRLSDLLHRIRTLTERAATAARHCTNMIEAKGLYGDLLMDMRRTSARILADLEHSIEVEGKEVLAKLKPRTRTDLFLFYQECLTNIIRHSGATRARTQLSAANGEICLTVTDNGRGLNGEVPMSLQRRARLLGAKVDSASCTPEGSQIRLRLKPRRFGILK